VNAEFHGRCPLDLDEDALELWLELWRTAGRVRSA
jgi:hypothetical protein